MFAACKHMAEHVLRDACCFAKRTLCVEFLADDFVQIIPIVRQTHKPEGKSDARAEVLGNLVHWLAARSRSRQAAAIVERGDPWHPVVVEVIPVWMGLR